MNLIEIAPEGEMKVGTFTDDNGVEYAAVELGDAENAVRLYYRLEHFVHVADHLRAVADAIVKDKAGSAPWPGRT
jgi:hypothetical protein